MKTIDQYTVEELRLALAIKESAEYARKEINRINERLQDLMIRRDKLTSRIECHHSLPDFTLDYELESLVCNRCGTAVSGSTK